MIGSLFVMNYYNRFGIAKARDAGRCSSAAAAAKRPATLRLQKGVGQVEHVPTAY